MRIRHIVTCCMLSWFSCHAVGQSGVDSISVQTVALRSSGLSQTAEQILIFENLNKVQFYFEKKQMKLIRQLNAKKDWTSLYLELKDYISKFGIQNFYKDTYWLWRLGKVAEYLGQVDEAKSYYRLVLKHHREDIDIRTIELHYDSLTVNERDYYVPLDYYYELVEFRKEVDTLIPPRGVLLNMGELINSEYADYGPSMSGADGILFFTSKRNLDDRSIRRTSNEDIYYSRYIDGYWEPSEAFEDINSIYNEGSACLSKDGKTLIFARCYAPGDFGNCDLYQAILQPDSTWGDIKNLGANVNSKAWDSHPSFSHSEDTLYFASDRIGGFGLSDIFYTYKNEQGQWQSAKNMGPVINTRNNELSPFYHPTHDILYFSSNGQLLNFGDFDIYKTHRVRDFWSEPKNIGPLVNGAGSEYYFSIDSESTNLFYARSDEKDIENLDLFSFPLPMEAQPTATTKLTGMLVNEKTGIPLKGIVSVIDLDNGIEIAPKYLRPDGSFEFELINENRYLIIIQGEGFFRLEEIFYLDGEKHIEKSTEQLQKTIEFNSMEFEHSSATLIPDMYEDLNKIIDFMLDHPDFKLIISGHTDSKGDPGANQRLSQNRADNIKDYLVRIGGIDKRRIRAIGYGSSQPIVQDEQTEEHRQLNRRVEFELYKGGAKDKAKLR